MDCKEGKGHSTPTLNVEIFCFALRLAPVPAPDREECTSRVSSTVCAFVRKKEESSLKVEEK